MFVEFLLPWLMQRDYEKAEKARIELEVEPASVALRQFLSAPVPKKRK